MDVVRVVPPSTLKQGVGQGRQTHRGAGMAVPYFLDRIGGQYPDGVDGGRIELAPVVGVVRLSQGRDVFECGHVLKSSGRQNDPVPTLMPERCGRVKGYFDR